MSYSNVKMLVDEITSKLDRYKVTNYHVHHSCKSSSMYIKINKKVTIRVADHYSSTDHSCKYNIGDHINNFKKVYWLLEYTRCSDLDSVVMLC